MKGLATVFERDYCGSDQPYAKYPKDVASWLQEIIEKQDDISWEEYKFDHPDGRHWIAYKVGTYLIDEAMKNSGKTVIELTKMGNDEILALAGIADLCVKQ
jgi:uncharacterized protein YjaZ